MSVSKFHETFGNYSITYGKCCVFATLVTMHRLISDYDSCTEWGIFKLGSFRYPASDGARNFYRPLMWGTSGSADAVVEHVVFRRCWTVYGCTCTTRIHLDSGCPANCVSVLQPRAARDPMVDGAFYGRARSAAMGHEPEMGQNRTTHWFLRLRLLLYYHAWTMAGVVVNVWYKRKKASFLLLFLSPTFIICDTFILFRTGSCVVFLEQWSNIWCCGNGDIFNNRYTRDCGGSDMWFVLSDVDYALMEYILSIR